MYMYFLESVHCISQNSGNKDSFFSFPINLINIIFVRLIPVSQYRVYVIHSIIHYMSL